MKKQLVLLLLIAGGLSVNSVVGSAEEGAVVSLNEQLYNACARQDVAAVHGLLSGEGRPNVNMRSAAGETPLMVAILTGRDELVSKSIVDLLIKEGAKVNLRDRRGLTALMWAARRGDSLIVKHLIESKANINLQDLHGYTALMLAVMFDKGAAAQELIDGGADLAVRNKSEQTALDLAVKFGKGDMVKVISPRKKVVSE